MLTNLSVLFLLSAVMEILLNRHHKKEKKFGPSPSNNYTSGTGKKQPFWQRQKKTKTRDAELGAVGAGTAAVEEKHHHHSKSMRPSHDTTVTDSTAAAPEVAYGGPNNRYQEPTFLEANPGYMSHHPPNSTNANNVAAQREHTTETSASHVDQVVYEQQPYAEVHHGGVPHAAEATDLPKERY